MFSQNFQMIIQFVDHALYGQFIFLPIGGGIIGAIFFVFIPYTAIKTKILLEFLGDFIVSWNRGVIRGGRFRNAWGDIQKGMQMPDELSWHGALISADNILDEIIERMGYKGMTTEERMRHIDPRHFPYFDEAAAAHKVVHYFEQDPDYRISREAAEKTIGIYRRIFEDLGVV